MTQFDANADPLGHPLTPEQREQAVQMLEREREKAEAEFQRVFAEESRKNRHLLPVQMTGPALHEQAIRACALAAAASLPWANLRPSHADIDAWRRQVLDLAIRFESYIRTPSEG